MDRCRLLSADALLLAGIWYFLFACPAHAYFDITLTNYIIQVIFGFGAALSFSISHWLSSRRKISHPSCSAASSENGEDGKPESS